MAAVFLKCIHFAYINGRIAAKFLNFKNRGSLPGQWGCRDYLTLRDLIGTFTNPIRIIVLRRLATKEKPGNWLTLQVHPKPGQYFVIITRHMASERWVFDNDVFINGHVFNCTGDGVRPGPPDVDTLDHIVLTQTKVQGRGSMGQVGVAKLYFPDL